MRELNVEQYLQRRCKRSSYTILCVKGEPLGNGWPDRVLLAYPKQIAFVELKRPQGFRARRQMFVRAMLKTLGFPCEFLDTKESVDKFMDWFEYKCTKPYFTAEEILNHDD